METAGAKLTVMFEDPFWIGLLEREEDGKYEVSKIVFGAEPRDCEVLAFLLENWDRLRFSPPLKSEGAARKERVNPKRIQREANRQLAPAGVGTRAQQALSLQREQLKKERELRARESKKEDDDRRFELRQAKLKKKRRGH